jgi:probable F420-dependent oxidoreductase
MKHWVTYPLVTHPYDPEFMSGDAVMRFARAAEAAGFSGIGFTDHPAPSDRWLRSGGHDALDPFAALAFVAAATEHLLLIPNIVVLPYRNPFLVAKAVATIDALSGGRFVLSTAVGYQRAEYRALGVEFEDRNELFDEALEVLRGIWSTDDFAYEGRNFTASGQTANPKPVRAPIWIGGNSQKARQRVASSADGWNPFPAPATMASVTKTVALETLDDLAPLLDDLWRRLEVADRDPSEIDISFVNPSGSHLGTPRFEADASLAGLEALSALGVTWTSVGVPSDSVNLAIEALEQYGEQVISAR